MWLKRWALLFFLRHAAAWHHPSLSSHSHRRWSAVLFFHKSIACPLKQASFFVPCKCLAGFFLDRALCGILPPPAATQRCELTDASCSLRSNKCVLKSRLLITCAYKSSNKSKGIEKEKAALYVVFNHILYFSLWLQCGICMSSISVFEEPVDMPCCHEFCRGCWEG